MMLKRLELHGFKSFAKPTVLYFDKPITAVVGPNGSGKSNVVEAIRFVLGEQSSKSLRSKSSTDLIFKGSQSIAKSNRAKVSIIFDNSQRNFVIHDGAETLSLDFDEITVSREVYADGNGVYSINEHEVRMKDIHELIASVNIGSSGHHIISQGEADRLLNASVKERKEILEESLGLKLYHYRIREASRKLEKSKIYLHESQSMRRELAPHMRFLKKQVDKIQEGELLRNTLHTQFSDYVSKLHTALHHSHHHIIQEKNTLVEQLRQIEQHLNHQSSPVSDKKIALEKEIADVTHALRDIGRAQQEYAGSIGRIEGMIEALSDAQSLIAPKQSLQTVDAEKVTVFLKYCNDFCSILRTVSPEKLAERIQEFENYVDTFYKSIHGNSATQSKATPAIPHEKIAQLQQELSQITQEMQLLNQNYQELEQKRNALQAEYADSVHQEREFQKSLQSLYEERSRITTRINELIFIAEKIEKEQSMLKEDIHEIQALLHETYHPTLVADGSSDYESILVERRNLERMKIQLESLGGGGGGDVIAEYQETLERDQFLEREITDIEHTISELEKTITELQETLHQQFVQGLETINTSFNHFFNIMFGGGQARLVITSIQKKSSEEESSDDEAVEIGIDIDVSLPRKKVKELSMLSGGERSLTSIALLFALSHVNPPPFLVLDETDAALDEANSRKYGDILEKLSEISQLIVVTHNRETMSRADILYGVTLGSDDASVLLSVKFDEAVAVAK